MLSMSGKEQSVAVELATLSVGVPNAHELVDFARAAVSPASDPAALVATRERLVAVMGEAAMVDAAAVVANFEMMTRLAECTGAVLHRKSSMAAGTAVGADVFLRH
jgi:hypothetical protein